MTPPSSPSSTSISASSRPSPSSMTTSRHRRRALWILVVVVFLDFFVLTSSGQKLPTSMEEEAVKSRCSGCKDFVTKFKDGLERTAKSGYQQEKSDWEPRFKNSKLGDFAASETRLVEVMEGLCDRDYYCNWVASEFEDHVETWYYHKRNIFPDFEKFLCVEKAKLCCPEDSFGPKCLPCSTLKCGPNGICQGAGTRTGTGKCVCDPGYVGRRCNQCAEGHFRDDSNETFGCRKCNDACEGCTGPGSDECVECAKGHIRTIISGNTCINVHKDLPSPSRLQLYLIGIHAVCLLLLTYASYIYKGGPFSRFVFLTLLCLGVAYHKLYYEKSVGADGRLHHFADPVVTSGKGGGGPGTPGS